MICPGKVEVEISQATLEDAPAIFEVQKSAYLSEALRYNDFGIPPLRQSLSELREEFKSSVFLKAMVNTELVGSVRAVVRDGTCFVGRLIVQPNWQRRGIGRALLYEVEKYFKEVKRFELFTGADSVGNLRLYLQQGYKKFKTEPLNEKVTLVYLEKYIRSTES